MIWGIDMVVKQGDCKKANLFNTLPIRHAMAIYDKYMT